MILSNKRTIQALIRLCRCTDWSAALLIANPRRQVFLRRDPYMASTGNLIGIFVGPSQHAEDIDVLLMGTNGDPVSILEGESVIKCNHG